MIPEYLANPRAERLHPVGNLRCAVLDRSLRALQPTAAIAIAVTPARSSPERIVIAPQCSSNLRISPPNRELGLDSSLSSPHSNRARLF